MKKIIIGLILSFIISWCTLNTNQNSISETSNLWTWVVDENLTNSWENLSWSLIEDNITSINNAIKIKTWKYCLFDECINDKSKITEDDSYYIWTYSSWSLDEEVSYNYKLSKKYDYFEIIYDEMMHKRITKIFKIWNNFIKSVDDMWCWWSNIDQKVYDSKWDEIKDFNFDDIKKIVFIWNMMYKQNITWTWWFWQPLDSYNKYKVFEDNKWNYKVFDDEKAFTDFVTDDALNKNKRIFKNYIVQFKKYPWINIMYESSEYDDKSIRVIYLWTDINYLSKNINSNWDLMDLSVTNKIISYYNWENIPYWLFDKDWNRINKVNSSQLPIFNVKIFNNNWNYLVYLKDWYELQSFAEMCKPLVYYYSKNKENNKLTLNLNAWDYFTKIIPNFSSNNTWDFVSENWKINVLWNNYDYLYYSLLTIWYKPNSDWWIVKWDDVVKFFEDKLTKINFNKKEKIDFIDFWKDNYENNKYYFISFKYKDQLDEIVKLDFFKKPDNEFRVLLDSYEIQDYSKEKYSKYLYENVWNNFDNYLIKRFDRWIWNTEVFEWGWVLKRWDQTIVK